MKFVPGGLSSSPLLSFQLEKLQNSSKGYLRLSQKIQLNISHGGRVIEFFMFSLFCQSVRLLLTLHLCICFLCIPFFITVCIFSGNFSLSFIWGFFLTLQELPLFFTFFISAWRFLWFVFIATKNFNSSWNEICARRPFLQSPFVLSIGKTSKIKLRISEIIPKISAQYLFWGPSNWIFSVGQGSNWLSHGREREISRVE